MDPRSLEDKIVQLRSLPTSDRILRLYQYAIGQCERGHAEPLAAVFAELVGAIDFAYGPVAEGIYRVYEYCRRKTREGDFQSVAWVLQDLRDACLDGRAAGVGEPAALRTLAPASR
jgi:flagellar protein FliS